MVYEDLNIQEKNNMINAWLGLVDESSMSYFSTPDVGSPFDKSYHHEHRYLKFDIDTFHEYVGANYITCPTSLRAPKKLTLDKSDLLIELGKGISVLNTFSTGKKKLFEPVLDALTEIDNILAEIEYDLDNPTDIEFSWGEYIEFKGMPAILIDGFEVFEGHNIHKQLTYELIDISSHPEYSDNIRHNSYLSIQEGENSRAPKAVRYYNSAEHGVGNFVQLQFKEEEAINLIKNAILKSNNPVFSSSFGKDSLVTLHLGLRACDSLNIPREKVNVFYSDTLNEFQEVRNLAKRLEKEWGFNLIVGKPSKTLKSVIRDHGGIDESYFTRKGDRRKDENGNSIQPLGEKCCSVLKHKPFYDAVDQYQFDLNIMGTRLDESRQRKLAAYRDGEYFYWISGNLMKLQPILHWTDREVFQYVKKYSITLPSIYNKNLILGPNKKTQSFDLFTLKTLKDEKIEDYIITDPLMALDLKESGINIYMPRVGCLMCPAPIRFGYLRWLREFYPKVFNGMLTRVGYAPQLVKMIPLDKKKELELMFGTEITALKIIEKPELIEEILDYMPCAFDILE